MKDEVGVPCNAGAKEYRPKDAGKLAGVDPQTIIDRIAAGALQREIAAEYGVTQPAIHFHITKHTDPDVWDQARKRSIASRLEKAVEDMEVAADPLMLARARESARLWMWRAEREHPDTWGQRPTTAIQVNGDGLQVNVASYSGVASTQQPVDNAVQQSATAQDLTSK